jgi:cyclic beta-1,2-glucan synthetase
VDVIRLNVQATDPEQARHIAVALEIKGTAGIQRMPLKLRPEWTRAVETIDWPKVGTLTEVVVLVSSVSDGEPAEGTLTFDIRFDRLSWAQQLSTSRAGLVGGVLLVGLLVALLAGLVRAVLPRRQPHEPTEVEREGSDGALPGSRTWASELKRDFVLGAGVVFIATLALAIYHLGGMGRLERGWSALYVALAGAALAQWLKYGLTGQHLTPAEAIRDACISGLLAATASSLRILQAPASWSEVLLLSQTVAAAAAVAYHAASAGRLAVSGKHLGAVGGLLIIGTPYAVGGLLLLASGPLLQQLGSALTSEVLGAWPAVLRSVGAVCVLFCFNEVVANCLSVATGHTLLRSVRAHGVLLAVAAAAVAAPWVAAWGSGVPVEGTGVTVADAPPALRFLAAVATAMLSQAGLWAEVYLFTALVLDAIHGRAPSAASVAAPPVQGMKKAMIFSGLFMAVVYVPDLLWGAPGFRSFAQSYPVPVAALVAALTFPLLKTVMESFDGSPPFFQRLVKSYRNPMLYLRGAVVGCGLGYALAGDLSRETTLNRALFGFAVGVAAFAGVNLLRDIAAARREQGRPQPVRVYLVQGLLGGFVGAAVGFYFDTAQVEAVAARFEGYLAVGAAPRPFIENVLLSKWGTVNLGEVTGGVSLLFAQSLLGVLTWAIPAWLFALNRTFLAAYFLKESSPITGLFTRDGLVALTQNMIEVLRWGLWMSPIINSFLRPTGEPSWYNQDGTVRTVVALYHDVTLSPEAFHEWSLQLFIALLAYDWVRVLIWLDHFGLRVATLVNLSFLGTDKLEQRLARYLAPASTARCVPEAIKRFTTWAPLLIPFYIPRGADWDRAWQTSQTIQARAADGLASHLVGLPLPEQLLLLAGAVVAGTALFSTARLLRRRLGPRRPVELTLANAAYEVVLNQDGAVVGRVRDRGYDVSRRSYDHLDAAGRALFLVESAGSGDRPRVWPVVGNYPAERAKPARLERTEQGLTITSTVHEVRTTVAITLPGADDPVELWTITVENLTDRPRQVNVVPYLEWVLNTPQADRGHTQYNRLFAEMEYVPALQAVLAWDKHSKAMGVLASDTAPEGFLSARIDFIGRARSLWAPRALEILDFADAVDTDAHPTFDPIGTLLVGVRLPARGSSQVRLLIGLARDKGQAIDLVARHLRIPGAEAVATSRRRKAIHPIRHGEVPEGTPSPYAEFSEDGRKLLVHTPFTPRPYDHTLSNGLGHVVSLTNRGLHTTASVNAQQNRLTPDWPDTVTREVPGEALYLYDPNAREWFSPTYHPLNDAGAAHQVEFGVDGSATYSMKRGGLETELTVFVPPEEPAGVYLLTVRNREDVARRLRVAPYFQMVLSDQPEHAGPLQIRGDESGNALFFANPRNAFRTGPAFVAVSCKPECIETRRGRFFGAGRGVAHPYLVEQGRPDTTATADDRPVATFLTTLEIPARGESTLVVLLGQAASRAEAEAVIRKYQSPEAARASLLETRSWWLSLMDTVKVRTSNPEFDRYLDWLKYQALAERIWARRGFYQASGAYGFRDQLQDAVNLIWMDPVLARRQILLHASQQFLEGDVVHWFHYLQDGRTGFAGRTHASDNLLWLVWGVVEYVQATGDDSILDERTPYLEAEQPLPPLPAGKHGMGFDPLRSAWEDTVYRHCLRALDLVLDKRMGAHGLPLIGTGDWNDGLDEIGSQGKGESVWLGFFLSYILERMVALVERKEGPSRSDHYRRWLRGLHGALEGTWRDDRYLRAIHDDGTAIGVKGSGVWEIDALTAAWAVLAGINPRRGRVMFDTALRILEQETTILLGWPPLREDTTPYLGRSSWYPEGVRENGMYCHGVQWLVGAARLLAQQCARAGEHAQAQTYCETAYRLWLKVSPIPHVRPEEIETYGGQPNKQAADMVTTFDPGRMIWHGYTGAAGWVFRQALEGVLGVRLIDGKLVAPSDLPPVGELGTSSVSRDVSTVPCRALRGCGRLCSTSPASHARIRTKHSGFPQYEGESDGNHHEPGGAQWASPAQGPGQAAR